MKRFFRNHKILGSLIKVGVALSALAMVWSFSAEWRGRLAARMDLSRGRYIVLAYGLPPFGAPEYEQILRNQYGIEVRRVAFCTVSPTLQAYADSYDEVSSAAAKRKFGKDVFEQSWRVAQRRSENPQNE